MVILPRYIVLQSVHASNLFGTDVLS
uniref:Uncharacterized protein n=1 Tax=Arundo donax TaxID=35708 RepID=A0A0A8ZPQ4_ARUDO